MALVAAPLTPDEEELLGHYRRLKKTSQDFRIEVFGSFKQGRRAIQCNPTAYYHLTVSESETKTAFDAID